MKVDMTDASPNGIGSQAEGQTLVELNKPFKTIEQICAFFGVVPEMGGYKPIGGTMLPGGAKLLWYPSQRNSEGWINFTFQENGEEFFRESHMNEKKLQSHVAEIRKEHPDRVTFFKEMGSDVYKFIGVYTFDEERTDARGCVWKRIATEYRF